MTEVLEVRPSCLLSHLRVGELFKLENIVITRYNAILCVLLHYMYIIEMLWVPVVNKSSKGPPEASMDWSVCN